jgi:methylamine--corrinoid protein Co-methyltransferase
VLGMSRADVNAVALRLLEKYEDRLADPPLGLRYQDCFDVASRRPGSEAVAAYVRARAGLTEMGLEFRDPPFYG